jgi:hypothetical protein
MQVLYFGKRFYSLILLFKILIMELQLLMTHIWLIFLLMILLPVFLMLCRSHPELLLKIWVKTVLPNILQPLLTLLHYRTMILNTRQIL